MANELNIGGPSGGTLYAIIRRESDSFVWNGSAFVAWNNADIATYDVPLTDRGGDYYSADFPSAIAAGNYFVSYWEQAGATPATDDLKIPADEALYWDGIEVADEPPSGDVEVFGTRTGIERKVGARNLREYVFLGDTDEDPHGTPEPTSIAANITDDLTEAATMMHEAWAEHLHAIRVPGEAVSDVPLGYSTAYEERALADLNENGAAVFAWAGRNIDRVPSEEAPAQIATAQKKWEDGLERLRAGKMLLAYQTAEGIIDEDTVESGGFETVELTWDPTETCDEYSG